MFETADTRGQAVLATHSRRWVDTRMSQCERLCLRISPAHTPGKAQMTTSKLRLPQLDGGWFLTDGGIETVLIYQDGVDLPEFAAFVLLETAEGRDTLRRYYRRYLDIAVASPGAGFVLESPTWRAGIDWGAKLGFDAEAMQRINAKAVALMNELRTEYAARIAGPIVVSGCIGPRGDGYVAGAPMEPDDARRAHQPQADALAVAGVDLITAITMTTSAEAMGVARAAARAGRASAISFTVETDGKLPSGEALSAAILAVDADAEACGHEAPAYYMINCAHPTHFAAVLSDAGTWRERIQGLRSNASTLSHAELDVMTQLDSGNPQDLADRYRRLRTPLSRLNVLGGCCGTDHRHVAAMSEAWSMP
jgi:homocysteine S-methyltransferase